MNDNTTLKVIREMMSEDIPHPLAVQALLKSGDTDAVMLQQMVSAILKYTPEQRQSLNAQLSQWNPPDLTVTRELAYALLLVWDAALYRQDLYPVMLSHKHVFGPLLLEKDFASRDNLLLYLSIADDEMLENTSFAAVLELCVKLYMEQDFPEPSTHDTFIRILGRIGGKVQEYILNQIKQGSKSTSLINLYLHLLPSKEDGAGVLPYVHSLAQALRPSMVIEKVTGGDATIKPIVRYLVGLLREGTLTPHDLEDAVGIPEYRMAILAYYITQENNVNEFAPDTDDSPAPPEEPRTRAPRRATKRAAGTGQNQES